MKTLVFVSLCLTVTLAMPPNPGLTKGNQSPLVGDKVTLQGHVEVEVPAPKAELRPKEQQEKMSPVVEVEDEAKPQVKVEQEVKEEPEMKAELELEAKPEVKVEQEVKEEPEMKVEQELPEEPEMKVEQEIKEEPEMKVELELEAKPEVKVEQDVKEEPEVKVEQEVKEEPEMKVEQEVKEEPEMKVELELEAKPEVKVEQDVKEEPDVKVEQDLQEEPDFEKEQERMMELELKLRRDVNAGQELQTGQNPEEGSEVKVVPEDVDQPEFKEEHEGEVMNLKAEYGAAHTEGLVEPLDDDSVMFPEEENDPADGILPVEEEEEGRQVRNAELVSDEDPFTELKPEMMKETLQDEELISYMGIMDEGPALDSLGQPMLSSESYFPEAESGREAFTLQDVPPAEEEPGRGIVRELQVSDQGEKTSQGGSCSSGVVLEGKCYQFFKKPKVAADAEFFCQRSFSGGHLASITSQSAHMEMMNLMMRHNGRYTRTWIGGLRYLDTGRFLWLDGAEWTYADWLLGEPNHTANVENCVEVLANGKFNDFTCWEPQPFICSFPLQ
uniref:probable inactive protein kinase DDB_G0270444 isoform X3 n=1 Tax=Solea senegalensis TaxID=28829 RepID=UPI001CD89F40|nr:probable inactive protein kinase DDB_G0270444 isoform X3 [Solea senegalensis]